MTGGRGLRIGGARLVLLAGLCVAAIGASGLGAQAAEARSFATGSSFGFHPGSPDAFLGQVHSDANQCRKGRLVKVFRARGRRAPKLIGRAFASGTGQWKVEMGSVPVGRYYVLVPRRKFGPNGRHVCRRYKSSTLTFGS